MEEIIGTIENKTIELYLVVFKYDNGNFWYTGGQVFPTKQQAIDSIIHYTGIVESKVVKITLDN